jgi:5-formyltetrahydrofolate cyclo-ligase
MDACQSAGLMKKPILRQQLLAKRARLTPTQVRTGSIAICRHLAEWPIFQSARTVLAYMGFDNEISLQPLLDADPEKVWALPRILPGGRLSVHRYQPERLVRHRWGLLEPVATAPLVPLREIELVLVPGVGFDEHGGRLGYGGGYYDRLLPQLAAVKVGIAHQTSCVPTVPCDEHDSRMDWLVRPNGLIRIGQSPPDP